MRGARHHRGMGPRPNIYKGNMFIPRCTFDIYMHESLFCRITPQPDETEFTQLLLKKNQDLTPTSQEQTAVMNLVNQIQASLDALALTPGNFDACQIDEVRQVGSFKKGTMLKGRNVADIVVILKTLPTGEAIQSLGARVLEDVNKPAEPLQLNSITGGFEISSSQAKVHILITTIPQNLRKLDPDLHLDYKLLRLHLAAIRHARWFEENAHHSTVKVLVRLIKDLVTRFDDLKALNPWIIDLLSHYAIINHPSRQPLPISQAFRRFLQLLSGGIFLPGSASIPDPCDSVNARVHVSMSLEQQDIVCLNAQTLLRILSHGGFRAILESTNKNILSELTKWDGVTVAPLSTAYEKPPPEKKPEETGEQVKLEPMDIQE